MSESNGKKKWVHGNRETALSLRETVRVPCGPIVAPALGEGVPEGDVLLIAGAPGAGKTTLALTISAYVGEATYGEIAYLTTEAEMTCDELVALTNRIQCLDSGLAFQEVETTEEVSDAISDLKPVLCVVDSLQGIDSDPLQALKRFRRLAKHYEIPIIVLGQVTKLGSTAGPNTLLHRAGITAMVRFSDLGPDHRVFEVIKSRYGAAPRFADFMHTESGLIAVDENVLKEEDLIVAAERDENLRERSLTLFADRPPLQVDLTSSEGGE